MNYCEVCGKEIGSGNICNSTACKMELEALNSEEKQESFVKTKKPKKLEK